MENFFFSDNDTNLKLGVRKTRFRITFFRRKRFRRSSWSENLEKTEQEVIRKKVIRKIRVNSETKASPGRTNAKVQICLQTQTSCRSETGMDDCVAAVTAAVAAY